MATPRPVVLAIDAGTTGVRTQAFDVDGGELDRSYREVTQSFPRPGWVEHDPDEIWTLVRTTLGEVARLAVYCPLLAQFVLLLPSLASCCWSLKQAVQPSSP